MVKFVPLEKRSKREQKEFHAAKRGSWNGVNPVSRKAESKKIYDRNRMKKEERRSRRDGRSSPFFIVQILHTLSE